MPNQIRLENSRKNWCAQHFAKLSLIVFFLVLSLCSAKDAVAAPVITSALVASGTVGGAFSYQITATHAPSSYGATGLPAGITVNTTTGLISGTPMAAGISIVTLSATNRFGTGIGILTLTIIPSSFFVQAVANIISETAGPYSLSFPNNTVAGDLIMVAVDFTNGTPLSITDSQGNTFTEVGTPLTSPGGVQSVVYYATNIVGGPDTVTVNPSSSSAWFDAYLTEYSGIDPANPIDAQAGASGAAGSVSSGNATTTAAGDVIYGHCWGDGTCTAGLGFAARSTFNSNLVEDEIAGSPGAYAATASASSGWTMQMVALKAVAAPVITSAVVASGTVGSAFSYQIAATNAPSSYGATGLPAGITVNTTTGLISGTPTAVGASTVTLSATNSEGTGNALLTLTVVPGSYFVQAVANIISGTAGPYSLSFPNNTVAGDLIMVAVDFTNGTPLSITDSQGNTLIEVGTPLTSPGGVQSAVYYAQNIVGGPDTVTVNPSSGSAWFDAYLTEYSGIDPANPIDAQAGASGAAGSVSSGNATTTAAGDVIYGHCWGDGTCTVGPGFTARSTLNNNLVEDEIAGSPGAYAATASASSGWTMQMVALKTVSSGTVSAPVASLSPSNLTFASQAVGTASAAETITLNNTGNSALSITSIALTGTNSGDFAQTNNCGTSVATGANCTVAVTFKPTASGTRTAAVTFIDNATGSPQTVILTGGGATAGVSLLPTSLAFGNQPIQITSTAQTVTLTNTGNSTLSITSLAVTGADASDFSEANTCGSSLGAGASCTIAVMFTPFAAGARTATVSISDNANGSPQAVSLSGTGSHDVVLSWTTSTTPGVVGYNVYRGTSPGGESSTPLNSTPINAPSYADENVTAGTTYYYVVTAVASDGVTQSGDSNETSATVPLP